jgi:hypothetical protein
MGPETENNFARQQQFTGLDNKSNFQNCNTDFSTWERWYA